MRLTYGKILSKKPGVIGKPAIVQVATKDCANEWLIKLISIGKRGVFFMHRANLSKFYEPYKDQSIFPTHKTFNDHFKSKYLISNP
jgi:hypothetical protein